MPVSAYTLLAECDEVGEFPISTELSKNPVGRPFADQATFEGGQLPWPERLLPSALITHLNVNKAGLVIQLSNRCTFLFNCQIPGPHDEPPHIFGDSHLSEQYSNIVMTPFSQNPLTRPSWRGCYVISSGGTV